MSFKTFAVGYGDNQGNGRGLYSVDVSNKSIQATLVYPCEMKPGAIIATDNRLYMSYLGNNKEPGILTFSLDEAFNLTFLNKQTIPVFITSFGRINHTNHLLGSSFYDGVDVVLETTDEIQIKSVDKHLYRPRSADIRQTDTHPHHICAMRDGLHAYSVDMGIDFVSFYSIKNHELHLIKDVFIDCPLGSGPRIMRISPDNRFAYLLHEISNTVAVYALRDFGIDEIQRISTLDGNTVIINSAAGCAMTADGEYLLITNRGENTLVLFKINSATGTLTVCDRIRTGLTPRDLYINDHQIIVAAQASDCLQLFEIDTSQHRLKLLNEVAGVSAPVGFLN